MEEEIKKGINVEKLQFPLINCIVEITVNNNPHHVAVYIGNGRIIHATRNGVMIEPLRRYEKRVRGYYKVKDFSL